MDLLEAILLGIIQGLTEFLPVSSSGHIELGKALLGSVPEEGMLMTVILHFATALSTIVIFRKEILEIFKGLFQFKNNEQLRFSVLILLSMIPAAFVGILFEDEIDTFFSENIFLVGMMLIGTGGLLFLANRAKATEGKVTPLRAIIIGIAQAIAILPGISRSGATIGTAVLLGVDRTRAARFSFLMVVPLIFGAMLVKTKDYLEVQSVEAKSHPIKKSEEILIALRSDYEFVSNKGVKSALVRKETHWTELKNEGVLCSCQVASLEERYGEDLRSAGLSEDQVAIMTTHHLSKVRHLGSTNKASIIAGFFAAFFTGLLACTWMIKIVKRSKLSYFSFYCFAVGLAAIIWSIV